MAKPELNQEAVEAAVKAEYPYLYDGRYEITLSNMRQFTAEQARLSTEEHRAEKVIMVSAHASAYLAALSEQQVDLDALEIAGKALFFEDCGDASMWNRTGEVDRKNFTDYARVVVSAYLSALPAQPHTMNTAEELHQLTSGTVVKESSGRVWKKFGTGWGAWFMVGDSLDYDANIIQLPVTVLHRPVEAP